MASTSVVWSRSTNCSTSRARPPPAARSGPSRPEATRWKPDAAIRARRRPSCTARPPRSQRSSCRDDLTSIEPLSAESSQRSHRARRILRGISRVHGNTYPHRANRSHSRVDVNEVRHSSFRNRERGCPTPRSIRRKSTFDRPIRSPARCVLQGPSVSRDPCPNSQSAGWHSSLTRRDLPRRADPFQDTGRS